MKLKCCFRMVITLLGCLLVLTLSTPAFSDTCALQTLASLPGTSCTVGDVQFAFGNYSSSILGSAISVSFTEFAPTAVALTFSSNFSVSGASSEHYSTGFQIPYTLRSTHPTVAFYTFDLDMGGVVLDGGNGGLAEALFSNCMYLYGPLGGCIGLAAIERNNAGTVSGSPGGGGGIPDTNIQHYEMLNGILGVDVIANSVKQPPYASASLTSATARFDLLAPTPEPSTFILVILGAGLIVLGVCRKRPLHY